MEKATEIRTGRHCVFLMHVHLVFVTKYRRRVFEARHIEYMRGLFARLCSELNADMVEMDGEEDHVHILVKLSAQAGGLDARERAQGHIFATPSRRVSRDRAPLLQRRPLEPELLCGLVWRRTAYGYPTICGEPADTWLNRCASSRPSQERRFPYLKEGVCGANF